MATQTALVVRKLEEPLEVIHDKPIPQPGLGQIQVRVTVAGLNPHDQKARDRGLFIKDTLPSSLANDVVGIVTAIGDGVTRFNIGDNVFSQASFVGLQQYAVLEEDFTALVPEGISEDECATLPTNVIAGVVGFFDPQNLGLPAPWSPHADLTALKDSAVLIVGGGSNCGRFATQLASLAGFGTIVVVGGNDVQLKGFGATHIIDRYGGDDKILQSIRNIVHDDLVYAFDAYNNPPQQHLAINALSNSKRGVLARLTYSRGVLNESLIHEKKKGYELKNVVGISSFKPDTVRPFWKSVSQLLGQGKIKHLEYVAHEGLDVVKVNQVLDSYREGERVVQTHFHVSKKRDDN
ncbi:putative alcohol dehydrogenase [Phaeosphaeria sp. MPI-PUGE-AT-0046c]|nr:putative alcohol dehydrogenase [Phaeosphaeria sp. MPI-PUGE-AT-0046c]